MNGWHGNVTFVATPCYRCVIWKRPLLLAVERTHASTCEKAVDALHWPHRPLARGLSQLIQYRPEWLRDDLAVLILFAC
jgi:hypothetical protein